MIFIALAQRPDCDVTSDCGMMGFRFTLLGPLTVRRGAESLPLGPAKRRAMLATLVLAANDPVSIDRLTDTVWDNPPTSAVANLRTHAAALRRLLFDDDGHQPAAVPAPRLPARRGRRRAGPGRVRRSGRSGPGRARR